MNLKNAFAPTAGFLDDTWNLHPTITEAVLASYNTRLCRSLRRLHTNLTDDQIKLIADYVQGNRTMVHRHLSDLLPDVDEAMKLDEDRYKTKANEIQDSPNRCHFP